jgi:hypothetical protein
MKGGINTMIDYTSRNLRPKTFFAKIERNRSGNFTVTRVRVLEQANQHARSFRRVDARDFTRALRNADINVA